MHVGKVAAACTVHGRADAFSVLYSHRAFANLGYSGSWAICYAAVLTFLQLYGTSARTHTLQSEPF